MATISKGLTQAYELQDFAYAIACAMRADMTNPNGELTIRRDEDGKPVDAPAVAQLIKAWEACQERVRIHRNKPMPGSLRPVAKPKKVRTISNKPYETLPQDGQGKVEGDKQGGKPETLSSTIDSTSVRTEQSMLKESTSTEQPSPPSAGVESV